MSLSSFCCLLCQMRCFPIVICSIRRLTLLTFTGNGLRVADAIQMCA